MYADLHALIEGHMDVLEKSDPDGLKYFRLGRWTVLYSHMDFQIPVALSSSFPFGLGEDVLNKDVFNIVWTVLPQENSTHIVIMLDADGINRHIGNGTVENEWMLRTSSPILLLEAVEAAMATTENWCMNPDIYDHLSEAKKENLRFDVRYKCTESYVWDEIEYTIFDDLWEKLIKSESDPDIRKSAEEKLYVKPEIPTHEMWDEEEHKLSRKIFNIYTGK